MAHFWFWFLSECRHVVGQDGSIPLKLKTEPPPDQGLTPNLLPETRADVVVHISEKDLERHRVQTALLVLHLIATAMLLPSLIAWMQVMNHDCNGWCCLDSIGKKIASSRWT